jgi:hypothetical protein
VGAKAADTRTQNKVHGVAFTFLQRYHDDGYEFLDRIITGDETWIAHITPETKQQPVLTNSMLLRTTQEATSCVATQ